MVKILLSCLFALLPLASLASPRAIEVHERLALAPNASDKIAALTLDACGGGYDAFLVDYLVKHNIPATVFVTRRWLAVNAAGVAILQAHRALFEIEDHGANHVPAILGAGRRIFGLRGELDQAHLRSEVEDGASAVRAQTGIEPRWYRGATGVYDADALRAIAAMGYRVAGFSVNADDGATLPRDAIVARLAAVRSGDIIIAHMNRPRAATGRGLAIGLDHLTRDGFRFVRLSDYELKAVDQASAAALHEPLKL